MAENRQKSWDAVWDEEGGESQIIQLGRSIYSFFYVKLIKKYSTSATDLVELGCGTAAIAPLLKDTIHSYTGMDYSESAVGIATKKVTGITGARIVCQDALAIQPSQKNLYDIAWSAGLVEHFPNYEAIIRSHYDLVKSGGLVLIVVPYYYSYHLLWHVMTRPKFLRRFWPWEDTDFKLLTKKELLACGKRVEDSARVSFVPPSIVGLILGVLVLQIRKATF